MIVIALVIPGSVLEEPFEALLADVAMSCGPGMSQSSIVELKALYPVGMV